MVCLGVGGKERFDVDYCVIGHREGKRGGGTEGKREFGEKWGLLAMEGGKEGRKERFSVDI